MPCLGSPLNVVVFLLDDMRADHVWVLEQTMARLGPHAVEFDRAYVTTPLCCPERASFLSGGFYAWETGVLTNEAPNGGATVFVDTDTLATQLQSAGVQTALFGKYLNEYQGLGNYVPPGWSAWGATWETEGWTGFTVQQGASTPSQSSVSTEMNVPSYVTEWQTQSAVDFLRTAGERKFLYMSFLAPHYPRTPQAQDVGMYADYTHRGGAFEEVDVSDKPAWIGQLALLSPGQLAEADQNHAAALESMLAVDRAIAAILDEVEASGQTGNTLFVLTSDNGAQWREHRLEAKSVGYEESVRVPLVISHPALAARRDAQLVAMNLDVPATVRGAFDVEAAGRGIDLSAAVCNEAAVGRENIVLQAWPTDTPTWVGLVDERYKYIEWATGELELYDLAADPHEEQSAHADPLNDDLMQIYHDKVAAALGMAITAESLAPGIVGEPYDQAISTWGGTAPLAFALVGGVIPEGLSLAESGRVTGLPVRTGSENILVEVVDSSISLYHAGPQKLARTITIEVREGEAIGPGGAGGANGACGCDGGAAGGGAALAAVAGRWGRARRRAPLTN